MEPYSAGTSVFLHPSYSTFTTLSQPPPLHSLYPTLPSLPLYPTHSPLYPTLPLSYSFSSLPYPYPIHSPFYPTRILSIFISSLPLSYPFSTLPCPYPIQIHPPLYSLPTPPYLIINESTRPPPIFYSFEILLHSFRPCPLLNPPILPRHSLPLP